MQALTASRGDNAYLRHQRYALLLFLALVTLTLPVIAQPPLAPITGIQQLETGGSHICALTVTGGVKCWGNNEYGQLGDGTTTDRRLPTHVSGLGSGVTSIAVGDEHSCALLDDSTVKCWGRNELKALGDGTSTNRHTPVSVSGLSGVIAITAGGSHTCAEIGGGGLKCWGNNYYGQLGNGNTTDQATPVNVTGSSSLHGVKAGYVHTCALTASNSVACWGVYNRQCTNMGCSFQHDTSPVGVNTLGNDVASISAGAYFNCALTTGGAVKCWGDNYHYQLGDIGDANPNPFEPFPIHGLNNSVTAISAGYTHACARRTDGTVRCWGENHGGQLGDGSFKTAKTPVTAVGLTGAADIASGQHHTCSLMADGGVKCWGSNGSGQLGNNESWQQLSPVEVQGLGSGVQSISAGHQHNCAVTAGGGVKCWGYNPDGQLGDGTSGNMRRVPITVSGISSGANAVSAGEQHSCAVTAGGVVKCWGDNYWGQLGDGSYTNSLTPTQAINLEDDGIIRITVGNTHSCAYGNKALPPKCWGRNIEYQIGLGTIAITPEPTYLSNLATQIGDLSTGHSYHSCAVLAGEFWGMSKAVRCWGTNDNGQIGDGTWDPVHIPPPPPIPPVNGPPPILEYANRVSAGDSHTCAITTNGRLYCWGKNSSGQVGNGSSHNLDVPEPVWISSLSGSVTDISAGFDHTCAVAAGGTAWCWGFNGSGQLGNGDTDTRRAPVQVAGLDGAVTQISTGMDHTCALTTEGRVKCWGNNQFGQLGNNSRDYTLPGNVLDDPVLFRDGFESP